MAEKRYYWLKLQRDFFKRHDIRIIEEMENGKDYLLFYLKLLVESIDHEGYLRFSDTVPYNERMLSVVTNTNIDIVRAALTVFSELGMIELLEDSTIFMSEVQKMIGASGQDEHKRESTRKRVQAYRERKKIASNEDAERYSNDSCNDVTRYSNVTCNGELEKELEKEKDIKDVCASTEKKRFTPPSIEDVRAYCQERKNSVDPETFVSFYESNGWKVGRNSMKDWKAAVRTWERNRFSKPKEKFGEFQDKGSDLDELQRMLTVN